MKNKDLVWIVTFAAYSLMTTYYLIKIIKEKKLMTEKLASIENENI